MLDTIICKQIHVYQLKMFVYTKHRQPISPIFSKWVQKWNAYTTTYCCQSNAL